MKRAYSFILLFLAPSVLAYAGDVRSIQVSQNSIAPIRTALGYSTVIEFQSKPTQAVLGDQDAFKLEYIGNSITLKPLIPGAKSNLFIYTEYDRFTFFVSTVSMNLADFLIRVSFQSQKPMRALDSDEKPETKKVAINKTSSKNGFSLRVKDFEISLDPTNPRAASILKFEVSSKKAVYKFQPGSFGLRQATKFINVEHIYLEGLQLSSQSSPLQGTAAILNSDWNRSLPLSLVFAIDQKKSKPLKLDVQVMTGKKGETKDEPKKPTLFKEISR